MNSRNKKKYKNALLNGRVVIRTRDIVAEEE